MKTYRNHPISIISFKFNSWFFILFFGLEFIVEQQANLSEVYESVSTTSIVGRIIVGLLSALIFLVLLLVYRSIQWYKTKYCLEENCITLYKKTLLSNRKVKIEKKSIASIHSSKPLIFRIFNVESVSITTNTGVGNENNSIDLIISKSRVDEIKSYFESDAPTSKSDAVYSDNVSVQKYGFLNVLWYHFIDGFFMNIIVTLFVVLTIVRMVKFGEMPSFATVIFLIPILFQHASSFFEVINLEVTMNNENKKITTSHGIIRKTEFTFNVDDIRVVHVNNYKLFRAYSVEVEVVGQDSYESNKAESHHLSLLCSEEQMKNILSFISYDYSYDTICRERFVRVIPHFIWFVIFNIIVLIFMFAKNKFGFAIDSFYILFGYISILFVSALFIITRIFTHRKYNYFMYSNDAVYYSEGFFKNKRSICRYKNIEYTIGKEGPIHRIFNTYSIVVHMFSVTIAPSTVGISHYDKNDIIEFEEYLEAKLCNKC